jgi:DNA-binding HxlR family transcriptional regulator
MRRAVPDPVIEARRQGPIPQEVDPAIEALVNDIIAKVADKWTMLILEALHERGTLRFTQLGKAVGRISQKMLTQTVRQMERDGLVRRTVHPVIPPHVDYGLTPLGESLGAAFCGVWIWAETHHAEIERARAEFAARDGLHDGTGGDARRRERLMPHGAAQSPFTVSASPGEAGGAEEGNGLSVARRHR